MIDSEGVSRRFESSTEMLVFIHVWGREEIGLVACYWTVELQLF